MSPFELTIRRRSGELVPVEVESGFALQRGRQMIVLVVRDLTGRRQTEETLRSLAYHDPLTGLPNRLLFHDRLSQAIERAKRARQLLTVMLVDLDRFKLINDSLGLETGDQIIKGVADRLVHTLRNGCGPPARTSSTANGSGGKAMAWKLGSSYVPLTTCSPRSAWRRSPSEHAVSSSPPARRLRGAVSRRRSS